MMKYDNVPSSFHSKYLDQAKEKLSILKMTKEERASYSYYQKKLYNDRDELKAAIAKGREEGREEEKLKAEVRLLEEKQKIAKKLLSKGTAIEDIAEITGLAEDLIKELAK